MRIEVTEDLALTLGIKIGNIRFDKFETKNNLKSRYEFELCLNRLMKLKRYVVTYLNYVSIFVI